MTTQQWPDSKEDFRTSEQIHESILAQQAFQAATEMTERRQLPQVQRQGYNTPRARILNEAMEITHKDRNANYGNPEDNFKHIAELWNAYLRVSKPQAAVMTSADVAVMNMLIKVARLGKNAMHHDSAVDIAGYAACLGDIQSTASAQVVGTAIPSTLLNGQKNSTLAK